MRRKMWRITVGIDYEYEAGGVRVVVQLLQDCGQRSFHSGPAAMFQSRVRDLFSWPPEDCFGEDPQRSAVRR